MPDILTLTYLAGFFDADGCVFISRNNSPRSKRGVNYQLFVNVSQKVRSPLDEFYNIWGGSLSNGRRGPNCPNPQWSWSISCQKALVFLQDITPHLRLKQEQAKLAIAFQTSMGQRGYALTDEKFARQDAFYRQLRALKQQFAGHETPLP